MSIEKDFEKPKTISFAIESDGEKQALTPEQAQELWEIYQEKSGESRESENKFACIVEQEVTSGNKVLYVEIREKDIEYEFPAKRPESVDEILEMWG